MLAYTHPRERVLFNKARGTNPFFYLYESLWMLAGRNDVAPLAYYNKRMANYSDDGETFNGAYGHRWRYHREGDDLGEHVILTDQLSLLVDHLKANPSSRRAVLQMWTVPGDLFKIGSGGNKSLSKDVCCNTNIYFAIGTDGRLDMTVCNRSNDIVWGTFGSDYVNLTFLQEYLAARVGVQVGRYYQFVNNLHAYTNNWEPEKWLEDRSDDYRDRLPPGNPRHAAAGIWEPFLLVHDPAVFELELPEFVERHSKDGFAATYREPFLREVAQPMMVAFHHHRRGQYADAMKAAGNVRADDWRLAATAWLGKRAEAARAKVLEEGRAHYRAIKAKEVPGYGQEL